MTSRLGKSRGSGDTRRLCEQAGIHVIYIIVHTDLQIPDAVHLQPDPPCLSSSPPGHGRPDGLSPWCSAITGHMCSRLLANIILTTRLLLLLHPDQDAVRLAVAVVIVKSAPVSIRSLRCVPSRLSGQRGPFSTSTAVLVRSRSYILHSIRQLLRPVSSKQDWDESSHDNPAQAQKVSPL